jgi:predicted amidohydrolase YtcJ
MTTTRALSVSIAALTALAGACGKAPAPEQPGADTVFLNGRVYTVDAGRPWTEAVAVEDGVIVYVGDSAGANDYVGSDSTVIDLDGRMMMPAFQDSHVHPISGGMEASACDLNNLAGLPEYRSTIAEYAAANPDVDWVLGGGWLMSVFGPGGSPSKTILDELVADKPVFLTSADGHSGWANSRALEIAGVTRDTPNPVDGIIDKHPETGEPIGSLQEGAMSLVRQHIPAETMADRQQGIRYSRDMFHRYGITSIQDASVKAASRSIDPWSRQVS